MRGRAPVEIAGLEPLLDPALLAFDGDAMGAGHHRRQRLGAAHAAEARGQDPAAPEVAAIMLAAHFGEGLVGALNDALGADVDPRSGRHLAVHHQALAIEFVEMVPGRPFRHQVRIGDQHARRVGMGAEHADRLARLDQQGLVALQPLAASRRSCRSSPSRAPPGRCRHRRPAPRAPRRRRGSRLFISIRIAASVAQLLQLISVPVGRDGRLLSRLECMRRLRGCERIGKPDLGRRLAGSGFAAMTVTHPRPPRSALGPGMPIQ